MRVVISERKRERERVCVCVCVCVSKEMAWNRGGGGLGGGGGGVLVRGAALVGAFMLPRRGDLVAAAAETAPLVTTRLREMRQEIQKHREGRELLRERPRMTNAFLDVCGEVAARKPRSFAAAYYAFMTKRKIDPDGRPPVRFVSTNQGASVSAHPDYAHSDSRVVSDYAEDDDDGRSAYYSQTRREASSSSSSSSLTLSDVKESTSNGGGGGGGGGGHDDRESDACPLWYILARYREVHDVWHVLFNVPTNLRGEAMLKMVEFRQTGLVSAGLAASVAIAKKGISMQQIQDLQWAWQAGGHCAPLMSIYYEKYIEEDIDDLRSRWQIHIAPR